MLILWVPSFTLIYGYFRNKFAVRRFLMMPTPLAHCKFVFLERRTFLERRGKEDHTVRLPVDCVPVQLRSAKNSSATVGKMGACAAGAPSASATSINQHNRRRYFKFQCTNFGFEEGLQQFVAPENAVARESAQQMLARLQPGAAESCGEEVREVLCVEEWEEFGK